MEKRQPDFENLLHVLYKQKPGRPTLFEFFLNKDLYESLADWDVRTKNNELRDLLVIISACKNAGYDYATIPTSYTNTIKFS